MEKESRNRCIYALLEALMDRMDDIEGAVEDLSEEIDGFGQAIYETSAEIENISAHLYSEIKKKKKKTHGAPAGMRLFLWLPSVLPALGTPIKKCRYGGSSVLFLPVYRLRQA